jgi:hypothetical protein
VAVQQGKESFWYDMVAETKPTPAWCNLFFQTQIKVLFIVPDQVASPML